MATKVKKENVELGFLEDTDPNSLQSHYFPSKIGGRPSWLSLKQLPSDINCKICGKTTIFLAQVYAPHGNVSSAFHRTIFVFVCRNPSCSIRNSNSNFLVFRSQLPRINEFYSADPPNENVVTEGPRPAADLCNICGCLGPKRCAKCHTVAYCGKEHQTVDWKNGHKTTCPNNEASRQQNIRGVLFPEFELITETEQLDENDDENGSKKKGETEKWKDYQDFLKSDKAGNLVSNDIPQNELEKMALEEGFDDKIFRRFKERIKKDPEQVLRYQKGGEPLWVSATHIPNDKDIPTCSCGAPRQFEFQVMPQLLSHLDVDQLSNSLDWGTLCVYTCSVSCDIGNAYQPEFLWKQDYSTEQK